MRERIQEMFQDIKICKEYDTAINLPEVDFRRSYSVGATVNEIASRLKGC